ncbi:hypothetical protein ACET3Z_021306 [Daucus carota]
MPTRDDLGLPSLKISVEKSAVSIQGDGVPVPDPFKDKMKEKMEDSPPVVENPVKAKALEDSPAKTEQPPILPADEKKGLVESGVLVGDAQPEATAVLGVVAPVSSKPVAEDDTDWKQVKRKNGTVSSSSEQPQGGKNTVVPPVALAPPAGTMPIYSALSRTVSKGQRKKAKRSGGKTPPFKN